jgi:transmembrane secretion effector
VGRVSDAVGLVTAMLAAAVVLAAGSLAGWRFAVPDTPLDRSPSLHWPVPAMVLDPQGVDGPVMVVVDYRIPQDRAGAFVEAMRPVGNARLRTGALHWDLYQDGTRPDHYLETFVVASWEEHLRQHGGRLTGSDRAAEDRARALVDPEHPFQVTHYLPARSDGHA